MSGFTPLDEQRARRDTPLTPGLVHLNNAGSSLMPHCVGEAVISHLRREMAIGGYEAAAEADARVEGMYESLARLLNCRPDEVAFVENATRAWDMAFYAMSFQPGDRILTARSEYVSNVLAYLHAARRTGVELHVIPNDEHGQVDVQALRGMVDRRVKLIALSHVPTQGGLVNPAAEIGAIAREHGIPFLLDACQSVGQFPVDVQALRCDMLSGTGRKFLRGPRGTGFLYVRREWIERLDPPFLDMRAATWTAPDEYVVRSDARRFESWESCVAGRLGLAAAVDYALGWGLEKIAGRVFELGDMARGELRAVSGVSVHDLGRKLCGIVTFSHPHISADALKHELALRGVQVSVSRAEYARFDFESRRLDAVVRASPHYFNTEDDIARLVGGVRDVVSRT